MTNKMNKENRCELGEILADFLVDHDEVKAVKNIFEEFDRVVLVEREKISEIINNHKRYYGKNVNNSTKVYKEAWNGAVKSIAKDVDSRKNNSLNELRSSAYHDGVLAERERWINIVQLILPLAKGYVVNNQVGSNQKYIEQAEKAIQDE